MYFRFVVCMYISKRDSQVESKVTTQKKKVESKVHFELFTGKEKVYFALTFERVSRL